MCVTCYYFNLGYLGLVTATISALSVACLANCSFFFESLCTCIIFLAVQFSSMSSLVLRGKSVKGQPGKMSLEPRLKLAATDGLML